MCSFPQSAQRAKELRAKFEEWEQSQDAKDQMAQMAAYDENGEPLETAGILRRKFEALRMHEEMANQRPAPLKAEFRPKRFKVCQANLPKSRVLIGQLCKIAYSFQNRTFWIRFEGK